MKFIIIAIIIAAIIATGIILFITREKSNEYIEDAWHEIQKGITNSDSLLLEEVYMSDEVSTDSTID